MRCLLIHTFILSLTALVALAGCTTSRTLDPTDGAPTRVDAGPGGGTPDGGTPVTPDAGPGPVLFDAGADAGPPCSVATAVDILFVVDNSNSMTEEQASLTVQIPRLVAALASGDRDGDGTPELPPIRDLHLGVVTTDMGNGGFPLPTCSSTFGDDGILITRGNTGTPGCMATYPPYLSFMPPGDVMSFATDFTCVARVGSGGCGFEQPLEAALKALTPSDSGITFNMGTVGHADRENTGFVRDESILAVVFATDEEDCSLLDPELINPSSSIYTGDLNMRCFQYPSAVHPVGRFVDGLRSVRARYPERFLLGVLAGVPADLVADPAGVNYDAILSDPRMQEVVDTGAASPRLYPSCNVPGRGLAFPPRRLVQVAQQFAPRAIVQSICQDDFGGLFDQIILGIGRYGCAAF